MHNTAHTIYTKNNDAEAISHMGFGAYTSNW